MPIRILLLSLLLLLLRPVHALTTAEAQAIAIGETEARVEALTKAIATADDTMRSSSPATRCS
jgi:urea transport system permease protein